MVTPPVAKLARSSTVACPSGVLIALYLAGHLAFRARMTGELGWEKALAAIAMLAVFAVTGDAAAWVTASAATAVLAALCVRETLASRLAHA